ncbi:hypothetical protein [Salinisphaera sp.]|uniref:hypothetical protein n=1 Tax=Salinisphaera sp. TaxID=1914330 RepID=UPI000C3E6F52|nr:hypothetical protein [Salinisphaera sp.]MAS09204.1 hypothetical protein [Salinisphaera sp.]
MGGMLPNAQPERWPIVITARMIALCDFVHIAVGAMVAFRLRLAGDAALVGNAPDNTVVLSLRANGQIRPEID